MFHTSDKKFGTVNTAVTSEFFETYSIFEDTIEWY